MGAGIGGDGAWEGGKKLGHCWIKGEELGQGLSGGKGKRWAWVGRRRRGMDGKRKGKIRKGKEVGHGCWHRKRWGMGGREEGGAWLGGGGGELSGAWLSIEGKGGGAWAG